MRKLLAGSALVLLAPLGAFAAEPTPKRDIFGLHPGMSYTQAMSVAADVCKGHRDMSGQELQLPSVGLSSILINCSAGMRDEFFATNPNLRQNGEEILVLTFAADLPEQPLSSVGYRFGSRAPDHDLTQAIADQFAPVCEKTGDKSVCFRDWLASMRVARLEPQGWSLSFNREPGTPIGFLILSDAQIMEAENTAGRERAKWNKFAPPLTVKP